jgi:hypothetical protein
MTDPPRNKEVRNTLFLIILQGQAKSSKKDEGAGLEKPPLASHLAECPFDTLHGVFTATALQKCKVNLHCR